MKDVLFPALLDPPDQEALRFEDNSLRYEQLRDGVAGVTERVAGVERVALWASPQIDTCIGLLGLMAAGVAAVPLNPKAGESELGHIVSDSAPSLVIAAEGVELPAALAGLERLPVELRGARGELPEEPGAESPALVIYTSGTTGPPKGVVLSRRAVRSNLDALAEVWNWSAEDVLVHGLPLFHVHGLVLGVLGPLRLGGRLHHVGRFSPEAVCRALAQGGTMLFGVPTMYHRLAGALESDAALAPAVRGARLLVSGSAPLAVREHDRIERATGHRIVERYGLTETLMNCSVRASGDRRPGYVGLPLPGIELRLVADDGSPLDVHDDETIGEVAVRGPNLFTEYLNRPDATEAALRDGWFFTGDVATRAPDGYIRIVGRRAIDLIKTAGYKVGAGEVENALLEHEAVAEVAVVGEPDADLGERIAAFVVLRSDAQCSSEELADHVALLLAPHKRPRVVRFVDELPRNEMGKLLKSKLVTAASED
ncbi:MAG: acyl-CoA synthetase [Actinomycetota bacterium]|nr:acyl-CoA synthetase [Actinomycetota bacterium]